MKTLNGLQTSYNGSIRGRYAGVGFTFDSANDLFIPPQPYPSWILDANTKEWKAPMPEPELTSGMTENGQIWLWDEENGEWKESEATVSSTSRIIIDIKSLLNYN